MPIISRTELEHGYKRWRASAIVDGRAVVLTEFPTRTISALRGRSTCSAGVKDLPAGSGKTAQIDVSLQTISGITQVRFFTGLTGERSAVAATMERQINIVDRLDLDKVLTSPVTWSSTSFVDAVTDLLEAAGLTSADIDSIYDPGSTYELGPVYDIELAVGESISQLFRELMEFGGTSAIVTPSGRVRVVDSPGIPAASSDTIYAAGATTGELGIFDAGIQLEGNESVVSSFTATGPKTPAGLQPDGTFTATGFSGKATSKRYRFAQSDAVCQAIAERELGRRARARTNAWFTAPLNPGLLPGDTVLLRTSRIGLSVNTPAYVMEVATDRDAGMRVIVSLGASLIDGYATSTPPPSADFSMTVECQPVILEGVSVTAYLVQCRDESRDPTGAEITSLSWTASGPGADPTSSTDPAPIFLFTDLTGASITLAIDSATGESASVTQTPVGATVQVLTRVVTVAGGSDGWQVLATTAGWRSFTGAGADCTAVPPFNETLPLWAGFANGKLYASNDTLASPPTLSTTLPDAIGALFVNEGTPDDVLAGSGTDLYRSQDGGSLWVNVFTFDDPITDIQSSPTNPDEIRVAAGGSSWLSYDGGATWSAVVTGTGTARMLASAPWGHAVAFDDGSIAFEEGYSVAWSPSAPSTLGSITPLLAEAGYIAGESDDLIRDGSLESMVLTAGAGALYKLVWNGASFDATLLTPTADTGPGKLINALAAYPIGTFAAAQIGYGPLGVPADAELLLTTWGISPGGIYHRQNGVWTLKNSGLPSGWYWHAVAVDPFNPDRWIAFGTSSNTGVVAPAGGVYKSGGEHVFWATEDAGATWTACPVTAHNTSDAQIGGVQSGMGVAWSAATAGQWHAIGHVPVSVNPAFVIRGTAASGASSALTGEPNIVAQLGTAGASGDVVFTTSNDFGRTAYLYYLSSASAATNRPSGSAIGTPQSWVARWPGPSRQVAVIVNNEVWATEDYRSAQPTDRNVSAYGIAISGSRVFIAVTDGITEVLDLFGTPTTASVYTQISVSPRQLQAVGSVLAARSNPSSSVNALISTDGGATWSEVTGPAVSVGQVQSLAVINRSGL